MKMKTDYLKTIYHFESNLHLNRYACTCIKYSRYVNLYICELGWKYSKGFVSDEMIKNHLPPPSSDTVILMCGPPPMINFACQPNLDKLGYSQKSRFAY